MPNPKLERGQNQAAADQIIAKLQNFNATKHPLVAARRARENDPLPLSVFARDEDYKVVGGILAKAWITWKWLQIDIVWVDENLRGKSLGSNLLHEIENMGRDHGCTRSKLSSWSFQAPGFYEKHGYQIYATLPNFPEGATDYQLWKSLIE